ncbi:AMP-binding protein [Paractinoplanes rishiriensis]|uniref:Amino acid adenylation protein n=1 Tax=Paractinoplanes rishiriensis TaxID=1050105 RepID=A0A919K518_9ACTN|nr:AMP-binding protein [Actinoplanes rishiriensis]GIF01027.1 amino acid adenylation protein [Actinoplanes rishiriensis]
MPSAESSFAGPAATLAGLVAATVARHPDAIAVELPDEAVTYRRLWDLAGGVACRLGAATRVGLEAGGGLATYAGYLGALRAGAAVVPVDPRQPAGRAADILRRAGVDAFVSRGDVESYGGEARQESGAVAYILFTSGSTGVPKGVPITHRNALAFLATALDRYELGPGSRVSHTFALTFDMSVLDLFGAWGSGATLVVPSPGERLLPVDYVVGRRLTHLAAAPSLVSLAMRTRMLSPGSMPDLRWSLFAGEALRQDQAAAWSAAAAGSVVENIYGPTEATVVCLGYRLPAAPGDRPVTRNGTVPIGAALPGVDTLILDDRGRPAGEGELCVRGPQRFHGYLDPEDDAGRFVEFAGDGPARGVPPGVRPADRHWYRTGDQVRIEDGSIVYLGRRDRQRKLRGHRVELGEVEGALRTVPGVLDSAVVWRDTFDGGELLAVCTGEERPEPVLRRALKERLPAYLVPAGLRWAAQLPLNANGKTDYAAVRALWP